MNSEAAGTVRELLESTDNEPMEQLVQSGSC